MGMPRRLGHGGRISALRSALAFERPPLSPRSAQAIVQAAAEVCAVHEGIPSAPAIALSIQADLLFGPLLKLRRELIRAGQIDASHFGDDA